MAACSSLPKSIIEWFAQPSTDSKLTCALASVASFHLNLVFSTRKSGHTEFHEAIKSRNISTMDDLALWVPNK